MKNLKYINGNGEELLFTNTAPFLMQSFTQGLGVNNYNSKGVNQDGSTYLGSTLKENDIAIKIGVIGKTVSGYSQCRATLNRVFNPRLGEGWLIYDDGVVERKIKCIPEKIPFMKDINHTTGEGVIDLLANDPLWRDITEKRDEIALWIGDFSFPLQMLETGIEVGHRSPSLIVNCYNGGDVESGMRIEFRALATLTNPSLFNVNTREFMRVKKEMMAGEVISVSTYFGDKRITDTLNGLETNAFNYIDVNSTFLQLEQGDNLFRYDADTGLDNLEVRIYHYDRYLGC